MADHPVQVTYENYVRVESARMFAGIAASARHMLAMFSKQAKVSGP